MITKLSSQQKDFNIQLSSLLSWESVSNIQMLQTLSKKSLIQLDPKAIKHSSITQLNLMVSKQSQWLTL